MLELTMQRARVQEELIRVLLVLVLCPVGMALVVFGLTRVLSARLDCVSRPLT